jgi:hypothetical protein
MGAVYKIENSGITGDNTKILILSDDDNQLCVKKISQHIPIFRIYVYDDLTKTNYELADYERGKYTIFNNTLFNLYFIARLKNNPALAKSFNSFIIENEPDSFKEFNIKLRCFRRRVNIRVIRLLRKTKKAIWE